MSPREVIERMSAALATIEIKNLAAGLKEAPIGHWRELSRAALRALEPSDE